MAMHNPPHPGEFIIQVYLEKRKMYRESFLTW